MVSFAGVGNPHERSDLRPGETVLDLGSGAGLDAIIASWRVGPTGRVLGVDLNPAMCLKAQAHAAATFSDVLKMTTYLTDIRDFPVLREVRTDYLNLDGPPASTVVAVAALGGPRLMLEIEAIAVLPRPYRQ